MAPLAHTLALLAMTVATVAMDVKWMDMAPNSFDDQYQGCGPAMTAALMALNRSEFQQNPQFAQVWVKAAAAWQKRGPPESPLSPEQATAIIAYTMDNLHIMFNDAVLVAGRSPWEYRDNFQFKTLHFLLTSALAALRDGLKGKCQDLLQKVCGIRIKAKRGDTVRFGQFISLESDTTGQCFGKETLLQVYTCQGVDISFFSGSSGIQGVLIPPFEKFEVTEVNQAGDTEHIQLHSTGTYSKYNCEWLQGGSVQLAPGHLGGLLLATTALAVATGIL